MCKQSGAGITTLALLQLGFPEKRHWAFIVLYLRAKPSSVCSARTCHFTADALLILILQLQAPTARVVINGNLVQAGFLMRLFYKQRQYYDFWISHSSCDSQQAFLCARFVSRGLVVWTLLLFDWPSITLMISTMLCEWSTIPCSFYNGNVWLVEHYLVNSTMLTCDWSTITLMISTM